MGVRAQGRCSTSSCGSAAAEGSAEAEGGGAEKRAGRPGKHAPRPAMRSRRRTLTPRELSAIAASERRSKLRHESARQAPCNSTSHLDWVGMRTCAALAALAAVIIGYLRFAPQRWQGAGGMSLLGEAHIRGGGDARRFATAMHREARQIWQSPSTTGTPPASDRYASRASASISGRSIARACCSPGPRLPSPTYRRASCTRC